VSGRKFWVAYSVSHFCGGKIAPPVGRFAQFSFCLLSTREASIISTTNCAFKFLLPHATPTYRPPGGGLARLAEFWPIINREDSFDAALWERPSLPVAAGIPLNSLLQNRTDTYTALVSSRRVAESPIDEVTFAHSNPEALRSSHAVKLLLGCMAPPPKSPKHPLGSKQPFPS
jgi:hypothetical protein